MNATASQTLSCADCGRPITGKFCSECGSRAETHADDEGWSSLKSEFFSAEKSNGLFAVVLSFLKAPVDTIIRLTDDPSYRSHWSFLTACVSAQLTLVYVVMPRLFAALFKTPDVANSAAVITSEIVQYAGMAILVPLQYYLCRAIGSRRRTPMSYVKLCALSVSYGALVSTLMAICFFAIGAGIIKSGAVVDIRWISLTMSGLSLLVILAFVTASHRRFWGLGWWQSIGLTTVFATLSWAVVYPALTAVAEKTNIPGTLGYLFG